MHTGGGWAGRIRRNYDKLLAVLTLVALLASLIYLTVTGIGRKRIEEGYVAEVNRMEPQHPQAAALDPAPFMAALDQAREPYAMFAATNMTESGFTPEARVSCVDCRRPIAYAAMQCPYCNAEQPRIIAADELDSNRDGIPDVWYRRHGMDPFDPNMADRDWDGDGFTNREEFEAGTDPTNPDSHPPVEARLRVLNVVGTPLPLRFQGRTILPGGRVRCQFNLPDGSSPMREPGQTIRVGALEFEFEAYEVRSLMRRRPGETTPRETDVAVAILRSGPQRIELEMGLQQVFTEYVVTFILPLDDTEYIARVGEAFQMRGVEYRVISVDTETESVVIRNESEDRELNVPRR